MVSKRSPAITSPPGLGMLGVVAGPHEDFAASRADEHQRWTDVDHGCLWKWSTYIYIYCIYIYIYVYIYIYMYIHIYTLSKKNEEIVTIVLIVMIVMIVMIVVIVTFWPPDFQTRMIHLMKTRFWLFKNMA